MAELTSNEKAFLKLLDESLDGGLTATAASELIDGLEMVLPQGENGSRKENVDRDTPRCATVQSAVADLPGCCRRGRMRTCNGSNGRGQNAWLGFRLPTRHLSVCLLH